MRRKNLSGRKVGFLLLLHPEETIDGDPGYRCECVCGTRLVVRRSTLVGHPPADLSCGCRDIAKEQEKNRKTAQLFKGKTMRHWAYRLGVPEKLLWSRLKKGWDIERIITTPKLYWGGLTEEQYKKRKAIIEWRRKKKKEAEKYDHGLVVRPEPRDRDPSEQ